MNKEEIEEYLKQKAVEAMDKLTEYEKLEKDLLNLTTLDFEELIRQVTTGEYGPVQFGDDEELENVYEPVELPKILIGTIEEWKERGASLQKVLVEEYLSGNSEEIYNDQVYYAIDKYFDDFCFAYVTGNYIVKKEPKWRIKNNEGHYLYTFHIGTQPTYMFQKKVSAGYIFDSKEKAEAINVFVGGEVEELESE